MRRAMVVATLAPSPWERAREVRDCARSRRHRRLPNACRRPRRSGNPRAGRSERRGLMVDRRGRIRCRLGRIRRQHRNRRGRRSRWRRGDRGRRALYRQRLHLVERKLRIDRRRRRAVRCERAIVYRRSVGATPHDDDDCDYRRHGESRQRERRALVRFRGEATGPASDTRIHSGTYHLSIDRQARRPATLAEACDRSGVEPAEIVDRRGRHWDMSIKPSCR